MKDKTMILLIILTLVTLLSFTIWIRWPSDTTTNQESSCTIGCTWVYIDGMNETICKVESGNCQGEFQINMIQ